MPRFAHSKNELSAAVADLKQQCGNTTPRVVICFASTKYDPAALSLALKESFPGACVFGCSTAGEIVSGEMLSDSVVAMFLGSDEVQDAACAIIEDPRSGDAVRRALAQLAAHFGQPLSELDFHQHVGLVLADGMSGAEERLLEMIGDGTDLSFVGGSAGDDLRFRGTHTFAEGRAHANAALLCLLRVPRGFDIIKTQSFVGTGKVLTATEVDVAQRKVLRFNGRPALTAYAEALGVSVQDAARQFTKHPVGIMVDGEPFVRSPRCADGEAIVFYCQIDQDTELEVLRATDIVADTRAAIDAMCAKHGTISALVDFDCILRRLQLNEEQRCAEYGSVFGSIPAIGFSTYGEAWIGHLNQTSTMLVLR